MSGILLVAALVLLLHWARGLDRRRRPRVVAQVLARDILEQTDPAFPRDPVLLRQRTDMISTPSPSRSAEGECSSGEVVSSATGTPPEGVRVPRPGRSQHRESVSAPRFSGIRRGRAAVALASVAVLALGLLTAVLAPFTPIPWTLPVFLLVLGAAGLACLRCLALIERSAVRADTAAPTDAALVPQDQETPRHAERPESAGPARRPRTVLFDNTAHSEESPERGSEARDEEFLALDTRSLDAPVPEHAQPLAGPTSGTGAPGVHGAQGQKVSERDREMLRQQARLVAAGKTAGFTPEDDSWAPVAVPLPTYVDAPEARREAPAPLEAPQEPTSTSSSLAEAASRGLDLDDVLSRRRA